jgi:spore maturation protein CgeB
MDRKLLLIGNAGEVHVGAHLRRALEGMEIAAEFCNAEEAFGGPTWQCRMNWWLRGHRPSRLRQFSERVLRICHDFRPAAMLTTGIAPVEANALKAIGKMGVPRLNYLTDDPWNPTQRARWFIEALPHYDHVFSPRHSIFDDLRQLGCRCVSYLPFAYEPSLHFPELPANGECARLAADVVFAGGADRDRVPYMATLIEAGFDVALYGGYWERYPQTRSCARGHADLRTVRKAVGAAKVALCLVRRANRDGHVMRSFELPAIGACILAENTEEHREIFGEEGDAVVYFRSQEEMLEKLRWLLAHDAERERLKDRVHQLIISGSNTYRDRLQSMLQLAGA